MLANWSEIHFCDTLHRQVRFLVTYNSDRCRFPFRKGLKKIQEILDCAIQYLQSLKFSKVRVVILKIIDDGVPANFVWLFGRPVQVGNRADYSSMNITGQYVASK